MTAQDLERERLIMYLDWAQVRAPAWYWPAFAIGIAAWVASYELGRWWGTAGALLVALSTAVAGRVTSRHGGVSMPRFRGMPTELKRAFLPLVPAGFVLIGIVGIGSALDDGRFLLLGLLVGPAVALCGAWISRRYRVAANQLARRAEIGQ